MRTAKLGDLEVSRLGLGAMGMSHGYSGGGSDDAESIRTIRSPAAIGAVANTPSPWTGDGRRSNRGSNQHRGGYPWLRIGSLCRPPPSLSRPFPRRAGLEPRTGRPADCVSIATVPLCTAEGEASYGEPVNVEVPPAAETIDVSTLSD